MTKNDDIVLEDLMLLNPKVLIVLGHFLTYAETNNLPRVITSIKSDRGHVVSTSTTHEEGRAIDMSSAGWSKEDIDGLIAYLDWEVGHLGAISASDLKQRVVIHHDSGSGPHFHLQVSRGER